MMRRDRLERKCRIALVAIAGRYSVNLTLKKDMARVDQTPEPNFVVHVGRPRPESCRTLASCPKPSNHPNDVTSRDYLEMVLWFDVRREVPCPSRPSNPYLPSHFRVQHLRFAPRAN